MSVTAVAYGTEEGSYLRLTFFVSLNSELERNQEEGEKTTVITAVGVTAVAYGNLCYFGYDFVEKSDF